MKTFTDLDVWKKSRNFKNIISLIISKFPSSEKYLLIDQLKRSSRSITANIAEGHGRYHYQENIQFCRQARGSLMETLDHLITAYDEKLITKEQLEELKIEFEEIQRLLNGYISYLKKKKIETN